MKTRQVKSLLKEAEQIELAKTFVGMGARLSLLESVTTLSKERLASLYRELHGKSPPKGQLPFSTDWYLGWQPNIHSSLFLAYYNSLGKRCKLSQEWRIATAYGMYSDQAQKLGLPLVLSITRAWRLIQFTAAGMLKLTHCVQCKGKFATNPLDLNNHYVCGLCKPPSRAGHGLGNTLSYLADCGREIKSVTAPP